MWMEVELVEKPDWLDEFRRKFDKDYPYHLTLKNQTYLEDADVDEIEKILDDVAHRYGSFVLQFEELAANHTEKGGVIMIRAERDETLMQLQQEVREELAGFGVHKKDYYAVFERNFVPHLTIARHLDEFQMEQALAELPNIVLCIGKIESMVLEIVDEVDELRTCQRFLLGR